MRAVAERGITRVLALAKVGGAGFFSGKGLRGKAAALMCPVAERLICGMTAGAEKILLSFFQFHGSRRQGGNLRFTHNV